ncbi:long-chain fatty acid--CoA ligase, partial [Mycobacterium tuberculosis]
PRPALAVWAAAPLPVLGLLAAPAVLVSAPFLVALPLLAPPGLPVLPVAALLASAPLGPLAVGAAALALL